MTPTVGRYSTSKSEVGECFRRRRAASSRIEEVSNHNVTFAAGSRGASLRNFPEECQESPTPQRARRASHLDFITLTTSSKTTSPPPQRALTRAPRRFTSSTRVTPVISSVSTSTAQSSAQAQRRNALLSLPWPGNRHLHFAAPGS